MDKKGTSRREFLKRTAYVAPVVFTMSAKPSFASSGSARCDQAGTCRTRRFRLPAWLVRLLRRLFG